MGGPGAQTVSTPGACAAALLVLAVLSWAKPLLHETFADDPFRQPSPRWCERYHHAHWVGDGIGFARSTGSPAECTAASGGRSSWSCGDDGCQPCGGGSRSPCAVVGDPGGNAVLMTTRDYPGTRRSVTVRFSVERQLPVGGSHLGLYVAMHPHCHTTVQAILVPDAPGDYHLNLAAFNRYVGGVVGAYEECKVSPLEAISPPLASRIILSEGLEYVWTLDATLDSSNDVVASATVRSARGQVLGTGSFTFRDAPADAWFGLAGKGARYAFGAQFSTQPSPSGGAPSLKLLELTARPGTPALEAPHRVRVF